MTDRYQVIGTITKHDTGESLYIADSFQQRPIAIMHAEQTYNRYEAIAAVAIYIYHSDDRVTTYTNIINNTGLPKSEVVPPYNVECKEHKLTVRKNEH